LENKSKEENDEYIKECAIKITNIIIEFITLCPLQPNDKWSLQVAIGALLISNLFDYMIQEKFNQKDIESQLNKIIEFFNKYKKI